MQDTHTGTNNISQGLIYYRNKIKTIRACVFFPVPLFTTDISYRRTAKTIIRHEWIYLHIKIFSYRIFADL